jgi:hypothetical protein
MAVCFGSILVFCGSMVGVESQYKHRYRNGTIGGFVGAVVAIILASGVYLAFDADYNRCEQRQRITVTK